ncbi:methyl-accepting chemotaxis protein [Aliidiomarina celeris]|uniref:methyl-accepting chemotaxis protein n=1 Tax=Aliidiomarina celeris TaxID=2249428 RepID=UPI000DEA9B19|nr:methyl-accepting chemotaxis protein [Aliidiomarina celeris]
MKLVQQLMVAFAVIVAVVAAVIISVFVGLGANQTAIQRVVHSYDVLVATERLNESLLNIQNGQRGFALTGNENFLAPYEEGKQDFARLHRELLQLTQDNTQQQQRLREVNSAYQTWMQSLDPVITARRDRGVDAAVAIVTEERGREGRERILSIMDAFQQAEQRLIREREANAASQANQTRGITVFGGILILLIAVGAALYVRKRLNQRLDAAISVAGSIADGNLTTRIDEGGNDEVAVLLSAMSNMQTQLRQMFTEINSSAIELNDASQSVSSTAEELSATSDEQTNVTQSIAAAVQQLSASIQSVADNANEAERIATSSGENSHQSAAVVEQAVHSMERIARVVRSASEEVKELGVQSEQINSIVNVIKSIADQTNLLALNAAIEAARAGEQGRGFSVVADEVRSLAQRTSASTDEIETMVAKIQKGTQDAVTEMENGVIEVDKGMELGRQTSTAIGTIRESFERVVAVVQEISSALNEQNASSQEVAGHIERFAASAEQNQDATRHTSATAHQLQQLAGNLQQLVKRFRI